MAVMAGFLDRRVELQSLSQSKATGGGVVDTWATVATVWASVDDRGGRQFFRADSVEFQGDTIFRIRYRADITQKWRIVWRGDNYDILDIRETSRNEEQLIRARARVG